MCTAPEQRQRQSETRAQPRPESGTAFRVRVQHYSAGADAAWPAIARTFRAPTLCMRVVGVVDVCDEKLSLVVVVDDARVSCSAT